MKAIRFLFIGAGLTCVAHINDAALGCAACTGRSDSPMAQGMNAGILALLGVITTVLCGAASFFVMLARRAAAAKAEQPPKS